MRSTARGPEQPSRPDGFVERVGRMGRSDLPEVAGLLVAVGLDPAGLDAPDVRVFGARDASGLAGSAAYEIAGSAALLRSVAVRPDLRGLGLGKALTAFALEVAQAEGVVEALLLTEGAEGFFAAEGWKPVERRYVDARFPDSVQTRSVCPVSAAPMRKVLIEDEHMSGANVAATGAARRPWARGAAGSGEQRHAQPCPSLRPDGPRLQAPPQVRGRFPALASGAAFFDGPGGTQVPDSVIAAMSGYLERYNANRGGLFENSRATEELIAAARAAGARFLGGGPDEIVFGPNMTTLNFALTRALGRELARGDEIVVTQLDHDANVAPWLHLAQDLDLTVRFARVADDFMLDLDHLASLLGPHTRVVAFPWASNAVGTVVDAARTAALAHEAGALAWVDAVHYAPHGPIDVTAIGADILLCSPYKFFGPHLGLAWGRGELLERLRPYKVRPAAESPSGSRFETGTQPHEALAGLVAAVQYVESVGYPAIQAWEGELGRRFLEGLRALRHIRLWGPPTMEGRVATFALTSERESPASLATRLAEQRIYVWHGNFYAVEMVKRLGLEREGLLRAGFVHYNTLEEIERLLEAL